MKPTTTRTIGPLHLEDLEPHHFEDLTRQLLYNFKPWKQLEATGRSGGDDGFDARGWEVTVNVDEASNDIDEAEDESESPPTNDRLWLIQCKREKAIGPAKLTKYLDDIPITERDAISCVMFVAACEFSKQSRDKFREKCKLFGFEEFYLWGKAEIEDMLFQPKNDYLLFAYFGISLQIRKRSLKTQIRSRLAVRNKLRKHVQDGSYILIRDASDDRYPYLDEDKSKSRYERGRWHIYRSDGNFHNGLHVLTHRYFAFVDDDGEHWDYFEDFNDIEEFIDLDPWDGKEYNNQDDTRHTILKYWNNLPEHNRAWYEIRNVVPYDKIIAIDEIGDDDWANNASHIFVGDFNPKYGPFSTYSYVGLDTIGKGSRSVDLDETKRIQKFPTLSELKKSI